MNPLLSRARSFSLRALSGSVRLSLVLAVLTYITLSPSPRSDLDSSHICVYSLAYICVLVHFCPRVSPLLYTPRGRRCLSAYSRARASCWCVFSTRCYVIALLSRDSCVCPLLTLSLRVISFALVYMRGLSALLTPTICPRLVS